MTLPAWWQVVTPHEDIRKKSFSEAVFAADLGDVLGGTAPKEYKDPRLFFAKTYMTAGLQNLVRNVLSRLSTGKGDPVIQLQTPFGGGKTHALLTLYHLVKSYNEINHLKQLQGLLEDWQDFSGARVAAFVGTAADPVKGRTPWGEIAHQLGCYEIVKEHDVRRVAPGKERIKDILARSGPTLILIDELLQYIVKANQVEKVEKITQGQTLAFLQELSEAVATSDKSVLVLTLPASILEQYDEEAEKALAQLQKVSGRVESIYVPVEGMEIYEVIRTRLFEDLGDSKIHRQVAEAYFRLYQGLGQDVPAEVREVSYRKKIERAYPFHPEFIDVLYERWGSFPTFQRTRGVLRLLAQIIGELYDRKVSAPLIHSSLVELAYAPVRREFIKHIGNEYDSIISHDIVGKARQIDQEMGSEYEKYGIAKGIATSVFLYSFSGGERRGVNLPWLRVALLREGIPSTIVGDAVSKLEDSLWYFHTEKRFYNFKNQPNLNRIIVDKLEAIDSDQVRESFYDHLKTIIKGAPFDIYLWPNASGDIPDNRKLKLILLGLEKKYGNKETEEFVREIFDNAGSAFRIYRNTLFILALDSSSYATMEKGLRRFMALQDIASDSGIFLSSSAKQDLSEKLEDAKKSLPHSIITAYRHVAWRGNSNGEVVWRDMGIPTTGQSSSLSQRVWQFLKDEERILSSLTPKLILDRAFAKEESEKSIENVYDVFLKTPGLPCLENEEVLKDAVRQGVKNGLLGIRLGSKLYYGEILPELSFDAVIVRPEKAEEEKKSGGDIGTAKGVDVSIEGKGYEGETPGGEEIIIDAGSIAVLRETGVQDESKRSSSTLVKQLNIKATVPWDKMAQVIAGVIRPLVTGDSVLDITLQIKAQSEIGFDRTTLDSKVKETLQQIGSNIIEWDEK
ncbi:MAG: DUF499 domain-containing protein [Thermosediminibacteraceae bacterium]|nr:DUF499 domain-containing protein [Thermosediminibacteraceae bacterium]